MSSYKSVTISGKHLIKSVQKNRLGKSQKMEKTNTQNICETKLIKIIIRKIKIKIKMFIH